MNFDEQISSMLKSIRNLVSILNTCKAKHEINVYKKNQVFQYVNLFFSIEGQHTTFRNLTASKHGQPEKIQLNNLRRPGERVWKVGSSSNLHLWSTLSWTDQKSYVFQRNQLIFSLKYYNIFLIREHARIQDSRHTREKRARPYTPRLAAVNAVSGQWQRLI